MALDHVRDFVTNLRFQPEDLSRGTVALFATRWVTHFCAPTFFLLAGVGIGLMMQRGKTPAEMSRYLVARGVWLLVLELVITPIGWRFSLHLLPAFGLVLWALGWSMILMAVFVHLPRVIVAVVALLMIGAHNLLDNVQPATFGTFAPLWHVLHVPGFVIPGVLFVAYPLIPWIGVMALGYLIADVYGWEASRRRRFLISCGAAAVALFIVLRALNGYGNPGSWLPQRTDALTVASFLNVRKYPPSLQFLLMTLGPALIALAFAESSRASSALARRVRARADVLLRRAHLRRARGRSGARTAAGRGIPTHHGGQRSCVGARLVRRAAFRRLRRVGVRGLAHVLPVPRVRAPQGEAR